MMKRLAGKIALVTGASQNIGRAIAETFAREGASVAIVDVKAELLKEVSAWIAATGANVLPIVADLYQKNEVQKMMSTCIEHFGRVDVLVNNAYVGPYVPLHKQKDDEWDRALALGLTAPMIACRAAIPVMKENGGGSIINIGSINSFCPGDSHAVYSAVKGGIVNFSRQIGNTYGRDGIRCNALCPGYITHDERDKDFIENPVNKKKVLATIPLNRLGVGQDIANAALFLASDESSFMTSQTLVIDGGSISQNAAMPVHKFEQFLAQQ